MEWSAFEHHIRHLPESDHRRIRQAYDLARQLHDGQLRKSGDPYFIHPVAVAKKLARAGGDAETIIATLLHDTVEDTPMTLEEIERLFGKTVEHLIDGVTKLSFVASPSLNEQAETIRKIFRLMQEDPRIMVIKLYDRLHNMETIEFLNPEKQVALAKETFDVFAKIADRLCMQDLRYQLEELCYSVLNQALLTRMRELRDKNEQTGQELLKKMRAKLYADFPAYELVTMELERKTWAKLEAQLDLEGSAVTGLTPVTIAFICPSREECYSIMGALHKPWRRESLSFQDYINSPEPNGYQGLHTTVILEDGTRVRCKIRTEEMHRYAHDGITTYCFDPEQRKKLEELLPWTRHLQTLTEDTRHRSAEFLQSLQSDILGESIIIHGPDDKTAQLPKDATALDAAIYLFGVLALRAESIRVNGKQVPFHAKIRSGESLDIHLADHETVKREWLRWVNSAMATATIRSSLSLNQSEETRLQMGKDILNQYLAKMKKGFIEEFDVASFQPALQTLNLSSADEMFMAIANGRLEPSEAYVALFERRKRSMEKPRVAHLQYTMSLKDKSRMERISEIQRAAGNSVLTVNFRRSRDAQIAHMKLTTLMTNSDQKKLLEQLEQAGARNIQVSIPLMRLFAGLGAFVLLIIWGIDPVFAHLLLTRAAVSPIDLTLLRILSLMTLSAAFLAIRRIRAPLPEIRLSWKNPTLWFSSFLFVLIPLTTYFSLTNTLPSHYTIPMTAAGMTLMTLRDFKRKVPLIFTWLFLGIGTLMLVVFSKGQWQPTAIAMTFAAVVAFTAFWIVSEQYKSQERVGIRTAQFFFVVCALSTLFAVVLLPFSTLGSMSYANLLLALLFCLVCVCVPYGITYYAISVAEHGIASRLSFLVIPITLFAEQLFLDHVGSSVMFIGMIVVIGGIAPLVLEHNNNNAE